MDALPFEPFQGEQHDPFILPGGKRAAILLHGFPGTPAEMRPLAERLNRSGWTAQGLLLPGFGADIANLPQTDRNQWQNAVTEAVHQMRVRCDTVVLVGFSMGAAVALPVAVKSSVDALVLIAPFRRMTFGSALRDQAVSVLWPILKLAFPEPKPFQDADLDDPQIQHGIKNFMPDADLDDPAVREGIRNFSIDPNILEQLQFSGRDAIKVASKVKVPTMVLQGLKDEVALPLYTRQYMKRLPSTTEYIELAQGDHEMIKEHSPAFEPLARAVVTFLEPLTRD